MPLRFNRDFEPAHGGSVTIAPGITRVTAPNSSPYTFHGTNTYLVGTGSLAVIDPGPPDESHLHTLLDAIGGRPVSHILVTHTHRDHSPLARTLQQHTGGLLLGAPPPENAAGTPLDAGSDADFLPDEGLHDGKRVEGDGWELEAIATPGHASNHYAFALRQRSVLFSGDHVMGWATSVVAPPDGSMRDYMDSLDMLLARGEELYLPGHGGEIVEPAKYVRGLKAHRRMRERAILERIIGGDRTIEAMVTAIYRDTHPRLLNAAGLSVLAHLLFLEEKGKVRMAGSEWEIITAEG